MNTKKNVLERESVFYSINGDRKLEIELLFNLLSWEKKGEWKIEKALKAAKNETVALGIKLFNSKCVRVLTFERCKIGSSSLAPHVTNLQSHWQEQEAGSQ